MEIMKESNMKKFLLVIIMSLLISSLSYADVKLPTVFSSNMVLQREIQVPVWGLGRSRRGSDGKFQRSEQHS